ncbi:MAG: mechanosensitive ion channel family protein [Pseudomonadota bacterium]
MPRSLPPVLAALLLCLCLLPIPVEAQVPFGVVESESTAEPVLPMDLTPDQVDGLLARLTDAEIRALLANELHRRAEEAAVEDMSGGEALAYITTRLQEMSARIGERVPRWTRAILNLGDRSEVVTERLAQAERGVSGMLIAALVVVTSGLAAGALAGWAIGGWRRWLMAPQRGSYWDKVIRTLVLGALDCVPILAFWLVTAPVISLSSAALGPLSNLNWIYTVGVIYSWGGLVIARRLFAPDAPEIRIAPLDDALARRLYRTIRPAAMVAALAWIGGGVWLHLGYGFPPALTTVALGGTVVGAILLYAVLSNIDRIRDATRAVFGAESGALSRIAVGTAPWLLTLYVGVAYLFWLAHWLERGQHQLLGPAGTLIVYVTLPVFDRLGREIIRSIVSGSSALTERFRGVFFRAWRVALGIAALVLVLALWGLDLPRFLAGPLAPGWIGTAIDVAVTLLITWLIWELIKAALHSDKKFIAAGEDVDPATAPKATRLDTLTPLFRNVLLAFVLAIGAMFMLSTAGVDIGPLLASAGILGIAVGFGAQALVRDIFSGMFFLIDDAFRVGEYIELSEELRGDVESISIRSLQLRHHRGPVITIPFGEMKNIINHTRDWVLYKMSFRMEPETDPKQFKKLVKRVGAEFMEHPDHGHKFFEPLKSQGVYYVDDDSALVFRVKFKCKPRAQFVLRREINHRLREVFEANGLKLARRKVEIVSGDEPATEGPRLPGVSDEVLEVTSAGP